MITNNLQEASTSQLSQEEKMKLWHEGKRGFNLKAASFDKLRENFGICKRFKYDKEAELIAEQAWQRHNAILITFFSVHFLVTNFYPLTINWRGASDVVRRILYNRAAVMMASGEHTPMVLIFKYLVFAIALGDTKVVEHCKQIFEDYGSKKSIQLAVNAIGQDQNFVNDIMYSIQQAKSTTNLDEDIEKHDTLNPKLWDPETQELKPEVDEKINLIVDEFVSGLAEDDIKIKIEDIILVGSNCSYNYTKDSDLDIHLIIDAEQSNYPPDCAEKLYSAYRSLFNKKFDIDFYGIPVELFVETSQSNRVSNGIYSVMQKKWISEPIAESIPVLDRSKFDLEFKIWEDRYNEIIEEVDKKKLLEALSTAQMIDILKTKYGKNYKFDKYTPEQIWAMYTRIVSSEKPVSNNNSTNSNAQKWNKTCQNCGYRLNDAGECPICDLNDEDLLYDSLHSENAIIKEDLNDVKSILADQIRGEWEAIQNYNKAVDDLNKTTGDVSSAIELLNDIADEEEVHVGELQQILSEIDKNVNQNIESGKDEADEKLNAASEQSDTSSKELVEGIKSTTIDKIDLYIHDIYETRKTSILEDGEYALGNLIFKELRNKGYLDNLKELKNKLISKRLSL